MQGFEYSRSGNPTRECTEECIAALENGKHGMSIWVFTGPPCVKVWLIVHCMFPHGFSVVQFS